MMFKVLGLVNKNRALGYLFINITILDRTNKVYFIVGTQS